MRRRWHALPRPTSPGATMREPRFDTFVFGNRRAKPVSAHYTREGWESTGIDWADYKRMGAQVRRQSNERRLPTPLWALNDRQLRKLIVTAMEERAGIKKPTGKLLARLARAQEAIRANRPRMLGILTKLCKVYVEIKGTRIFKPEESDANVLQLAQEMFDQIPLPNYAIAPDEDGTGAATARAWLKGRKQEDYEVEIEGLDTFLRYTERDGGAGVIAAVVYLYYRAGMDSVGVGEELGLKPPHVRQILWRLNETFKNKFGAAEKDSHVVSSVEPGKPHTAGPSLGVAASAPLPLDFGD